MNPYDQLGAPTPPPGAPSQPAAAPAPVSTNPYDAILHPKAIGKAIDRTVGREMVAAHNNPFATFMGVLEAPQRAVYAGLTGQDIGKAIKTPGERDELAKAFRSKIGLQQQEDTGILAGQDLPHKLARGTANFAVDAATDPVSYLPVGKIAEGVGKAFPPLARGAEALGDVFWKSPLGKLLNPEASLGENVTAHGAALAGNSLHKAMDESRATLAAKLEVVKREAAPIRAGVISKDVADLFTNKSLIPVAKPDMNPHELVHALARDQAPLTRAAYEKGLDAAGVLKDPSFYLGAPHAAFKDQAHDAVAAAQEAMRHFGNHPQTDNDILNVTRALTHLGNQMFLANPVPHGGNLANLSYLTYGIWNTLAGLGRSLEVAAGRPSAETQKYIDMLVKYGGNSQYQNIFTELGFTKVLGSKGLAKAVNTVAIPAQRASNYAQNQFLNPLETGLRAQALKAEEKSGTAMPEAVRNIHTTFGSDEPNRLSRASTDLGTPFAKFHGQTAVGRGISALGKNPARVGNVVKADLDYNSQVNPNGPQYRSSVPSMSTARALVDPQHYLPPLLGPLGTLAGSFSSLSDFQKGKVSEALSVALKRYIPVDQVVDTINELVSRSRGQQGESGVQDIVPSIVGGYYQKKKPGT